MSLQILLIDDDPVFCGILRRFARQFAGSLAVDSFLEGGSEWPDARLFDVAIVDQNLGDKLGLDLVRAFPALPVVLISANREVLLAAEWPSSVRFFVDKRHGMGTILSAAIEAAGGAARQLRAV